MTTPTITYAAPLTSDNILRSCLTTADGRIASEWINQDAFRGIAGPMVWALEDAKMLVACYDHYKITDAGRARIA